MEIEKKLFTARSYCSKKALQTKALSLTFFEQYEQPANSHQARCRQVHKQV